MAEVAEQNPIVQAADKLKATAAEWLRGTSDAETVQAKLHEQVTALRKADPQQYPDLFSKVGQVLKDRGVADGAPIAHVDTGVDNDPTVIAFDCSVYDSKCQTKRSVSIDLGGGAALTAQDARVVLHPASAEKDFASAENTPQRGQVIVNLGADIDSARGSAKLIGSVADVKDLFERMSDGEVTELKNYFDHRNTETADNGLALKVSIESNAHSFAVGFEKDPNGYFKVVTGLRHPAESK